jgi:hypothetical protein
MRQKLFVMVMVMVMVVSAPVMAVDAVDALNGRANVMECTREEVLSYMSLPASERTSVVDFDKWQKAYVSTGVLMGETDPTVCLSLLYGNITEMGARLKDATSSLMSMSMPGMSDLMSQLTDKLSESICSRTQTVVSGAESLIVKQGEKLQADAEYELEKKYGKRAMEEYATEAVIPPKYQSMGLEYRNGELTEGAFRSHVQRKWQNELEELKDEAKDDLSGD